MKKNAAKSIEIIQALLNGGEDAVKIIITLYNFYRRSVLRRNRRLRHGGIEQTVQRQALRDEACRADGVALHTCAIEAGFGALPQERKKDLRDFSVNDRETVRALVLNLLCV